MAIITFPQVDPSTGSVTNSDIVAGAGIELSKLAALTASRVALTDASGFLTFADTATYPSLTELSYVKGASSAIQTQLTAKMTNPMTTGGDVIYGGASGVPTRLANGTAGYVLTSAGTTLPPTWTLISGVSNTIDILNYTCSASPFTTTSATYVDVTGMSNQTVSDMAAGTYLLTLDMQAFQSTDASLIGTVSILVDDATTVAFPAKYFGYWAATGNGGQMSVALTAASHTFKVQCKKDSGAGAIQINQNTIGRLTIERIF